MLERMRGVAEDGKELFRFDGRRLDEPQQVLTVTVVPHRLGETPDLLRVDVTHAEGNLFGTGNLEPLPRFEHVHERGRFDQRVVRSRVEPGRSAAEDLDRQLPRFEVTAIEVGDLEFAAGGRFEAFGDS